MLTYLLKITYAIGINNEYYEIKKIKNIKLYSYKILTMPPTLVVISNKCVNYYVNSYQTIISPKYLIIKHNMKTKCLLLIYIITSTSIG